MKLRFQRGAGDSLESLHPAYFALVMATGIVATAARIHGLPVLPELFFWLNSAFLGVLVLLTLLRAVRFPRAFAADIASHSRGVGFFTTIAACGVYGTQLLAREQPAAAAVFLVIAVVLWFVVMYGMLAVLTVQRVKPGLDKGINGGWLVSVVATQSVSILTVLVLASGTLGDRTQPFMFLSLVFWLGGGGLYLSLMTLIFFRYTFFRMDPEDLTPPYWINMGAVAISTLAGATLLEHAALSSTVTQIIPFVKGLTLFYWAVGTWWIPMLLVLGVWRYVIRELPFTYDPLYWGGVFPLGMYSVCTFRLSQILETPFLMPLSFAFMAIAIAVWLATFAGMVDNLLYPVRDTPANRKPDEVDNEPFS